MKNVFENVSKYKILLLIIVPALFLYMLVIVPSGSYYCIDKECGYYFWGAHGRDAIWHLSIIQTSFNKFPFTNPAYAGERLYGYNWLMDFFIYLLFKLGITPIISYFKLIPVVWFVVFTLLLIIFARKIKDNLLFVSIFLFFSYFAGSFSYFLTLYHRKTIQGSSILLPQPVIHTMSNLQYAFSLLLLLALLILIVDKKINMRKILVSGILIFLMLGLKFYAGAIGLFMIFTYVILVSTAKGGTHPESNNDSGVVPRRNVGVLPRMTMGLMIIAMFVIVGIFLFYNPLEVKKTGFPFVFSPFALVHPITEATDQFYLRQMTDARYFLQQFKIGPKLIAIETINLFLFLFFNLGTRFFGLLYIGILFLKRKLEKLDLAITLTILFSIFLTVTLVQKGVWWNTIQFFFYAIFLLTIYLTKLTYDLLKSKRRSFLTLGIFILILSIPTSYDVISHFLKYAKPVYLPKRETEALNFLEKQPDGVVFIPIREKEQIKIDKNLVLHDFEDSAYVAAFSSKQLYIAEIQTLSVMGVTYKNRLAKVKNMDCSILTEVDYVYEIRKLSNEEQIIVKCKPKNIKKIFENEKVFIYSILK